MSAAFAPGYNGCHGSRVSGRLLSMRTLQRPTVTNFKSIREQELLLQTLNVFIGGNGSGKSNLIDVFRFLKLG
jgi:ABC-type uncharacterized transport system ATPase subunit